MPRDRDFKRLVRQRMLKTSESYTTARIRLLGQRARRETGPPHGAKAVNPSFERSPSLRSGHSRTRRKKPKQQARTRSFRSTCWLPSWAEGSGVAAKALHACGADQISLRRSIQLALLATAAEKERVRPRPAEQTKRSIDASLKKADRWGHEYIGSGHLLLGLIAENAELDRAVRVTGLTLDQLEAAVAGNVLAPDAVAEQLGQLKSVIEEREAALGRKDVEGAAELAGLAAHAKGQQHRREPCLLRISCQPEFIAVSWRAAWLECASAAPVSWLPRRHRAIGLKTN